jgi:hypothetical protein
MPTIFKGDRLPFFLGRQEKTRLATKIPYMACLSAKTYLGYDHDTDSFTMTCHNLSFQNYCKLLKIDKFFKVSVLLDYPCACKSDRVLAAGDNE